MPKEKVNSSAPTVQFEYKEKRRRW